MSRNSVLDDLPADLAYLKPFAIEIAAATDDRVEAWDDFDFTGFERAVQHAMEGLSTSDAEERCRQHKQLLEEWLAARSTESDRELVALHALVGPLAAAYEMVDPYDDADRTAPNFVSRQPSIDIPNGFELEMRGPAIAPTNNKTEMVVQEISWKSYRNLLQEFSRPRRKTVTEDGNTVFPQQQIALQRIKGVKNVIVGTEDRGFKEVTYLLECSKTHIMARILFPANDADETEIEPPLDSLRFN